MVDCRLKRNKGLARCKKSSRKCYKVSWNQGGRRLRSATTFKSKSSASKNLRRAKKNKESVLARKGANPKVVQSKC